MWFQPNHQIKFTIFVTFFLIRMIFLIFDVDHRITNVIRCRERVIFLLVFLRASPSLSFSFSSLSCIFTYVQLQLERQSSQDSILRTTLFQQTPPGSERVKKQIPTHIYATTHTCTCDSRPSKESIQAQQPDKKKKERICTPT